MPRSESLFELVFYFLRLGATGFGGPIALVSYMQRDLVEKRQWFSQEVFKEGMALSQLAPGPMATQLAIYLGWAHYGVLGATLVGFTFVLPSFLLVIGIAYLYLQFGSLPIIQNLFHGIGPAVIAIVCLGAWKLSKRNLEADIFLWIIAALNAGFVAYTEREYVAAFVLSGILYLLFCLKIQMKFRVVFLPVLFWGNASPETLKTIFLFFLKSGAFVFGSGLAIVPFLHGGVVGHYHWLNEQQFLDAVAVAMITPGPVVITVAFIGFLVAGFPGAMLAALGTFLPCYLFTVIPAPYFSKISKNNAIKNFVNGVTAAAVGAIVGAAIILGRKSLNDIPAILIFMMVLAGILKLKKIPEPAWILFAAIIGLVFSL